MALAPASRHEQLVDLLEQLLVVLGEANVLSLVLVPGTDEKAGTDTIPTTPITARNDAALTKNTSAALVAASSRPPIAGPIARARFWLTDPSAIACGRSDAGTSSGWSV